MPQFGANLLSRILLKRVCEARMQQVEFVRFFSAQPATMGAAIAVFPRCDLAW